MENLSKIAKGGKHKKAKDCVLIHAVIALFLVTLATGIALDLSHGAEKYPSRPIRIIVPWSLGGSTDIVARTIQPYLKEVIEAPTVIVENKPAE